MDAVVGEAEAYEQRVEAEGLLEERDDGDAAAFADEDWFFAEAALDGFSGKLHGAPADRDDDSGGAAFTGDFDRHAFRAALAQRFLEFGEDFIGILARDHAHGDLGGGFGGDDRLTAGALIAAGEAVDIAGWAGPAALKGGVPGFVVEVIGLEFLLEFALIEGEPGEFLALARGQLGDIVIEAGGV